MSCVILAVILVFGNVMKHGDTFRVKVVSYIMIKFDDSSALLFLQENPIYTSKIKSVFIIDVAVSPNPYVDCFICYIKRLVYDFTTPQGDRKDVMVHKTILYLIRSFL